MELKIQDSQMLTGDTPIRDDGYEGGSVEVECEEIISRAELHARCPDSQSIARDVRS